jgi:hypothetical protein
VTKIFFYCSRCASGVAASDEACTSCGHNTIDANRVIQLQSAGTRLNRKRPRGAAAPIFGTRRGSSDPEPPLAS